MLFFIFRTLYAPTIISRQSSKLCGSQSGNENCTRNPIHLLNLLSGLQRLPPLNTQKPKCLPLKNVILLLKLSFQKCLIMKSYPDPDLIQLTTSTLKVILAYFVLCQ